MDTEPYENSFTKAELRRELRRMWNQNHALNNDLIDLPDVPSIDTMMALRHAAMNVRKTWELGKDMQREHGLDLIPPNSECECAAGLWALIKSGIESKKLNQNNEPD